MTLPLAEVSWSGAFMAVGIVWGIAFMVWAACKHGGTTVTTTTEYEETPVYKQTKVSYDQEEIKRILREMRLEEELEAAKKAAEKNPISQVLKQTAAEMDAKKTSYDQRIESAIAASQAKAEHDVKNP